MSEPYVRPRSAASLGDAPGRGRLQGRRILVVGGGQRVVDLATDPVGNGRAMSLLLAREGTPVAVADPSRDSAAETASRIARNLSRSPLGRQATAWEIAHAVLFFMSDESVYVTAQTLAVDSGLRGGI